MAAARAAAAADAAAAAAAGGSEMMNRRKDMKSTPINVRLSILVCSAGAVALLCLLALDAAPQTADKTPAAKKAPAAARVGKAFRTPDEAADALIDAAEKFDVTALDEILGPDGKDIINSGEPARDKERAATFAARAREKKSVEKDPKSALRRILTIGNEDWPFPVPIVKRTGKWYFDSKAGLQEILYRRVGANELDAIQACHIYVEAQHDYALMKKEGGVNQYAQRIISTPGKQDGLAWQEADGKWGGPLGENIAKAIAKGYTTKAEPFHGYFFKVLKGQGPAAPLGQMDFVVKGVMIGGFALIAAPAQYRVTGVKTFMVSHDGVVYEKDLGPNTPELAKKIELFNPDRTWSPVKEN